VTKIPTAERTAVTRATVLRTPTLMFHHTATAHQELLEMIAAKQPNATLNLVENTENAIMLETVYARMDSVEMTAVLIQHVLILPLI